MSEQNMLSIFGKDDVLAQSKGLNKQFQLKYGEVPLDIFQTNLAAFVKNISVAFDKAVTLINNYELDEIEINVDVSVTGGISLIGSMEAEASGGITLRFKRIHGDE